MPKASNPKKNRKIRLWILIAVEIAVLLVLVVGLLTILRTDPLEGNWYQQDRLMYKFSGKGKGVLVMEGDLARFTYTVQEDRLEIDFLEEDMPDRIYRFNLEGDVLTLEDETGEGPWQYIRKQN